MSRFDSSHAQCAHSLSAVNSSSPHCCRSPHDSGATAFVQRATLGKQIRPESSNTLAFGEPIGFKWANAIFFYSCDGTCAPFNPALSPSNRRSLTPSPSTTVSQMWFLVLMFSIWFNSPGNSCNITRHLPLRLCHSYRCGCGTALDEMGTDSFTTARGVILRSGWNQKFCRFQLTRPALNGLSRVRAKALRCRCMTAKVAGHVPSLKSPQAFSSSWLTFKCFIRGTQR